MKRIAVRDTLLLIAPAVLLMCLAFWQTWRESLGMPETDLENGPRRLVISPPRFLPLTPLEVYKGDSHHLQFDVWAAGNFGPLSRTGKPGFVKTRCQQFLWKAPRVEYRQDNRWLDAKLLPDPIGLMPTAMEGGESLHDKWTMDYFVVHPSKGLHGEPLRLSGAFVGRLRQMETSKVANVTSENEVRRWQVCSKPLVVNLPAFTPREVAGTSRDGPFKLSSLRLLPVETGQSMDFELTVHLLDQAKAFHGGEIAFEKSTVTDSQGKIIEMGATRYRLSQPGSEAKLGFIEQFSRGKSFESFKPPFTLRTALSWDGSWPYQFEAKVAKPDQIVSLADIKMRPLPMEVCRFPIR